MQSMSKAFTFMTTTAILSVFMVYITFTQAIQFSGFAVGLAKAVMVVILFIAFDKFVLKGINTLSELKQGNVAYAVFLLAIALLFAITVTFS